MHNEPAGPGSPATSQPADCCIHRLSGLKLSPVIFSRERTWLKRGESAFQTSKQWLQLTRRRRRGATDDRKHRGRWRRDASKCNFMPQFFSFRSCRPAKVSSALEDRLIFSSWFCIFPRGNKLADQASATRELRINVFDVQYYRSIDDCDSYCITQKYRTFYKKNFSLSFEY